LFSPTTGIGKYVGYLINFYTKKSDYNDVFVLSNDRSLCIAGVTIVYTPIKPYNFLHFLILPFVLLKLKNKHNVCCFHAATYSGLYIKLFQNQITTVHDLMYRTIESYFSKSVFINKFAVFYYDLMVSLTLLSSTKIISISDSTSLDLLKLNRRFKSLIIPHFIEKHRNYLENTKYNSFGNYVLYVGNTRYQKNIKTLVLAFENMKNDFFQSLVIVTKDKIGFKNEKIFVLNDIDTDEQLNSLYGQASIFVLPSLYEGFGFPILEALSEGCQVASSNAGSLSEFSKKYVMFFDPNSANELMFILENYPKNKKDMKGLADYLDKYSAESFNMLMHKVTEGK